jgi:phage shock protein C
VPLSNDSPVDDELCGGLGEYFNIDPTIIRMLFVLGFFVGHFGVFLAYIIMILIIPEELVKQVQQ